MNPTKTIERHETSEPVEDPDAMDAAAEFDPPTEELQIVSSDIQGRKELLAAHIIDIYLKGHLDLDLNNPVHREIRTMLDARGELRPARYSSVFD